MCSSSKSSPTFGDLKEDEIRVLYLEPGSLEEPLAGELHTASVTGITPDTFPHIKQTATPSRPQRRVRSRSPRPPRPTASITGITPGTFPNIEQTATPSRPQRRVRCESPRPPRPHSSVRYEAVSYAWEGLEKLQWIDIRNIGKIAITALLFHILRHFRYAHTHRTLWVDAICIDQAHITERNHQVAKMADIFAASSGVLVWLGTGESADLLAFATIDILWTPEYFGSGDGISLSSLHDSLCGYAGPHALFRRNLAVGEDAAITALTSIANIFQARWFQRMWVIQETVQRHSTLYFRGYHSMGGPDLGRVLKVLEDNVMTIRSRNIRIDPVGLPEIKEQIQGYYPSQTDRADIMLIFLKHSNKHCHDSRDRVFALRRVLGIERFDELRPDYGLNYVEVFRRFVCVCLNVKDGSLKTTKVETEEMRIGEEEEEVSPTHPALTLALVGTELNPRSNPDSPSWSLAFKS